MTERLKVKTLSSLEKLLVEQHIEEVPEVQESVMFKNERHSFQVAYQMGEEFNDKLSFWVTLESPIKDHIRMNRVIQMASETPIMDEEHDDDVLRSEAGMLPDLLMPTQELDELFLGNHRLCSLWLEILPEGRISGEYPITIVFTDAKFGELNRCTFKINIVDQELPKQEMIHTEWFYCDCLKVFYDTESFDERHWSIIEKFMKVATSHGINMILAPVFTYALDTAVGAERPTTQLVGVTLHDDGSYSFDFTLFDRFVETARQAGYEYFEIGHLFTQWGAKATPKIMATTPDGERRIFGWDVSSSDPSYREFLQQLLPALRLELGRLGIEEKTYYHISDEPREENLEEYKICYNIMKTLVPADRIIDAMSNFSFYENDVLDRPIPATFAIQSFIDAKVPELWTYYCCTERIKLSNRFLAMPLYRTRALGIQLYKYNIAGFLHWGYNFYFSQYSLRPINHFFQTDCDGFAESGDAFLVYPGPGGVPYESVRLKTMADVMQDVRACRLLESLKGREFVDKLIDEYMGEITFTEYPCNSESYINFRKRVLEIISET